MIRQWQNEQVVMTRNHEQLIQNQERFKYICGIRAKRGYRSEVNYLKSWEEGSIMGVIRLNRININIPIVQGTTDNCLSMGAGHIRESDLPGQLGNCVLAGHRSYTYGKMFNRLGEIQLGDEIEIDFGKMTFIYEVYQIRIVEPDDLSVLNRNDINRILTLITCHPIRVADKRLVIHSKLKNKKKIDEIR